MCKLKLSHFQSYIIVKYYIALTVSLRIFNIYHSIYPIWPAKRADENNIFMVENRKNISMSLEILDRPPKKSQAMYNLCQIHISNRVYIYFI